MSDVQMNTIFSRCADCDSKSSPCEFSTIPVTPHHALLNSNQAPFESDVVFIKSKISQADGHMVWLDGEIPRLRERLKQLERERVLLSKYQAENQTILSPLRRLPPELLSEIFGWTLGKRHPVFREKDSPWLLTHVSRTWRAVSVSTPSLWSTLTVDFRTLDPSSSFRLDMIETYIARAPKIRVFFYGSESFDHSKQIDTFRCLARHASRWEELVLNLPRSFSPVLDTQSLQSCVPLLRKVWMRLPKKASAAQPSLDFLNTAPLLRNMTLRNQPPSFSFHPPSQLTQYQLEAPFKIHLNILKLAPGLVAAHIQVKITDEPWPWTSHEIIHLPSLCRLHLTHREVLEFIRAPALESLYIPLGSGRAYLESFLSRSSCTLRCLCIPDGRADEILSTLANLPSLVELRIRALVAHGVNTLLAELATSYSVAPQLACISFTISEETRAFFDYRAYVEMVKSRWASPDCALVRTTLVMCFPDSDDWELAHCLDELQDKEGLEFKLLTGEEGLRTANHWIWF